jgi:hypothetical protein
MNTEKMVAIVVDQNRKSLFRAGVISAILFGNQFIRSLLPMVLCITFINPYYSRSNIRGSDQTDPQIHEKANADSPLELIGHIGGTANAIKIEDHYAYVCLGPDLIIYDIANPLIPVRVGSILFSSLIYDIKVQYPFVYVAAGTEGLQIVDITNRTSPVLVASRPIPDLSFSIGKMGNYLYVGASGPDLLVYDISIPSAPAQVYSLAIPSCAIEVIGNYAYVEACSNGLIILNLLNPAIPTVIGQYQSSSGYSIYVSLPIVYLAGSSTINMVNVSDPTHPTSVGLIITPSKPKDLLINGIYAYVISSDCGSICQGKLTIFDLTNHLQIKSTRNFPGDPTHIAIYNHYIFTTGGEYGGFRVIDVINPKVPTIVYTDKSPGTTIDIKINGNYAYITDRIAGLKVVNVLNPYAPTPVGSIDLPSEVKKVSVNGNYAYVSTSNSGLQVINISNPNFPALSGVDTLQSEIYGVASSGSYVYFGGPGGFQVDLVSNPNSPVAIGYLPMIGQGVYDVELQDHYAFLGHSSGFSIANISNPFSPSIIGGSFLSGEVIFDLDISGKYLYAGVQGGTYGYLGIYDISNYSLPLKLNEIYGAKIWGLSISGNYLYEATDSGLVMLDLRDPVNPVEIGQKYMPSDAKGVVASNNLIYLADRYAGLYIFKTTSASIYGKVIDTRLHPLLGYTISLNDGASAITDANGKYQFNNLNPGDYRLIVQDSTHAINPPFRQVTIPPDADNQNFMILAKPVETILTPGITTTLNYSDLQGNVTEVLIPGNAISDITCLTLTPTWASSWEGNAFTGHAFDLEAYQNDVLLPEFSFNQPVTVTIQYSHSDIDLLMKNNQPSLWEFINTNWNDPSSLCNLTQKTENEHLLIAPICKTGKFGMFGPTNQYFLPQINR